MPREDPILQAASRLFGYRSLRPGQREAIQSVLDGVDTLAVMPTAGGKSAIYELSGPLLTGPTLVISPLIALQRDQLATLEMGGKLTAVALNSMGTARERQHAIDRLSSRWTLSRLRLRSSRATGQRRRLTAADRAATGPVGGRRGAPSEPMRPRLSP